MTEVVKKKRGRPRTRPLKVSENERRLLAYPPTKETWLCKNRYGEENTLCDMPNAGSHTKCWLCGTKKPEDAPLLWPVYVKICEKFEIDPEPRKRIVNIDSIIKKENNKDMWPLKKKSSVVFDNTSAAPVVEAPVVAEKVAPVSEAKTVKPRKTTPTQVKKAAVKKAPATPAEAKTDKPAAKPVTKRTTKPATKPATSPRKKRTP
jgi:hypothetical protein